MFLFTFFLKKSFLLFPFKSFYRVQNSSMVIFFSLNILNVPLYYLFVLRFLVQFRHRLRFPKGPLWLKAWLTGKQYWEILWHFQRQGLVGSPLITRSMSSEEIIGIPISLSLTPYDFLLGYISSSTCMCSYLMCCELPLLPDTNQLCDKYTHTVPMWSFYHLSRLSNAASVSSNYCLPFSMVLFSQETDVIYQVQRTATNMLFRCVVSYWGGKLSYCFLPPFIWTRWLN